MFKGTIRKWFLSDYLAGPFNSGSLCPSKWPWLHYPHPTPNLAQGSWNLPVVPGNTPLYINSPLIMLIWLSHLFPVRKRIIQSLYPLTSSPEESLHHDMCYALSIIFVFLCQFDRFKKRKKNGIYCTVVFAFLWLSVVLFFTSLLSIFNFLFWEPFIPFVYFSNEILVWMMFIYICYFDERNKHQRDLA